MDALNNDNNDNHHPEDVYNDNDTNPAILNAVYLLSLETRHNLSQSAVNAVAENTSELIKRHLQLYRDKLKSELNNGGNEYFEQLLNEESFQTEFDGLNAEYKRVQFYKKHFKIICPQPVTLGSHLKKTKGTVKRIRDQGYFIPFEDLIKALYCLPEVLYWFQHSHKSNDNFVRDICDANYVKNNQLFKRNPKALQIILYNDDIEIVNPLGTHIKKHKITLFYATFANIPPEYRSKLHAIFLIGVARSRILKSYGISKLLDNFIKTVNVMSSGGLQIEANGKQYNVEGAVVMAPADTPAANSLGGFKEGVGFAYKKCRTCLVSNEEIAKIFRDDGLTERTKDGYNEKCRILEGDLTKSAKAYWSKMWGINGRSCLSNLVNFDIIECLIHDPMHVLLEGLIPYEMALLFHHCIDFKKYFTLKWLNSQIDSYPYSMGKNKPEPVERKHYFVDVHVKQTAATMLTLLEILPHILSKRVSSDDTRWQNFLNLIQITFLCLTPYISLETVIDLRNLIETHLQSFRMDSPKATFPPKMHFLLHMVKQMQNFGPGRHQWCMRFEAKHAFFKNKKWKCFKNLPLSMANFHQKWLCGQMMASDGTFSENYLYQGDEIAEGVSVTLTDLPDLQRNLVINKFPTVTEIYITPRVKIHGCVYNEGAVLIYSPNHPPHFVQIVKLFIKDQEKHFIVQDLKIIDFLENSLCYHVDFDQSFRLITYSDLFVKFPLDIVLQNGNATIFNKFAHISVDIN